MAKNKTSQIALIINITLSVLLVIILLNFSIHVIRTKKFNNQLHNLSSGEVTKDINVYGRIICVADAFDAMTSSRCYRPALSREYVLNEIKNNLDKQFDTGVGQAMLDLLEENKINIEGW